MAEVEPAGREPTEGEGGAHTEAFFVAVAEFEQLVVDGVEDLEEDVGEATAHAAGGEFEALGE